MLLFPLFGENLHRRTHIDGKEKETTTKKKKNLSERTQQMLYTHCYPFECNSGLQKAQLIFHARCLRTYVAAAAAFPNRKLDKRIVHHGQKKKTYQVAGLMRNQVIIQSLTRRDKTEMFFFPFFSGKKIFSFMFNGGSFDLMGFPLLALVVTRSQ